MNNTNAQQRFKAHLSSIDTPRPIRSEWEKSLADLRPWLSPEKFKETEKIHWRMFERADRWYQAGRR